MRCRSLVRALLRNESYENITEPPPRKSSVTAPASPDLWQTSGRNRLTYNDRRRLDLEFVRNRSLRMYVGILLRTILEVLRGQNSW